MVLEVDRQLMVHAVEAEPVHGVRGPPTGPSGSCPNPAGRQRRVGTHDEVDRPTRSEATRPPSSALTVHMAEPARSSITDPFCTADSGHAWFGTTSVASVGDGCRRPVSTREHLGRRCAIGTGLCVLVGVTHNDTEATARRLADKIWGLRVIDDENGVMNRSVADTTRRGARSSASSRCTATPSGGRRPSWITAARPEHAEPLVETVIDQLRASGATVATGRFRTEMAGLAGQRRAGHCDAGGLSWRRSRHARPGTIHEPGTAAASARRTGCRRMRVPGRAPCAARSSRVTTACSLTAVRCRTSPSGGTKALNPVGDTCTTHRPSRSRGAATTRPVGSAASCRCSSNRSSG